MMLLSVLMNIIRGFTNLFRNLEAHEEWLSLWSIHILWLSPLAEQVNRPDGLLRLRKHMIFWIC